MIDDFIHEICEILNIPTPSVSYDTSHFSTETMQAQFHPASNTLYLKKAETVNPDQLFCIAHELRHSWQIKKDESLYFSSYKTVEKCPSVEAYNLQLAELDANAFATIVMTDFFHLKPTFERVSDLVKTKIFERIEELKITESSQ